MRLPCPPVPRTFQLVGCVLRDGRGVERAPCDPPADRRFSRLPVPDDDDSFHDQAARARLGTVLREKWRLERLLGAGGMGVVYAATHRNGKRVALKMLHPEFSGHPEVRGGDNNGNDPGQKPEIPGHGRKEHKSFCSVVRDR